MQKQAAKDPVINMKRSDIIGLKSDVADKAAEEAFFLMLAIPMMVLHDDYGFGKKRGEHFVDQVLKLYDSYDKGYVTIEDLKKCLWEEGGIRVERTKKPFL